MVQKRTEHDFQRILAHQDLLWTFVRKYGWWWMVNPPHLFLWVGGADDNQFHLFSPIIRYIFWERAFSCRKSYSATPFCSPSFWTLCDLSECLPWALVFPDTLFFYSFGCRLYSSHFFRMLKALYCIVKNRMEGGKSSLSPRLFSTVASYGFVYVHIRLTA